MDSILSVTAVFARSARKGIVHIRKVAEHISFVAGCALKMKNGRLLECDYFENKHTSSRHYKIKSRKPREDEVLKRLGLIMEKMEIAEPTEQPEHNFMSEEAKRILKKHGY